MAKKREKEVDGAVTSAVEARAEAGHPDEPPGQAARLQAVSGHLRETLLDSPDQLSLLIGAGTSLCAGLPMMAPLTVNVFEKVSGNTRELLSHIRNQQGGDGEDPSAHPALTIEHHLSELVDYLSILHRRNTEAGIETPTLTLSTAENTPGPTLTLDGLATAVREIKTVIREELSNQPTTLKYHLAFVRAIHRAIRDGRPDGNRRIDYFTLNYDTLFESVLGLARIPYVDGMSGGHAAYWNPAVYAGGDVPARVYKLHGSIDWMTDSTLRLPVRLSTRLPVEECNIGDEVMIFPASTKYRETQLDPFAQLFARFRECLQNHRKEGHTILTIGYAFGDAHVNAELESALGRPDAESLRLIAVSGDREIPPVIVQWLNNDVIRPRVLVVHKEEVRSQDPDLDGPVRNELFKFERLAELVNPEGVANAVAS